MATHLARRRRQIAESLGWFAGSCPRPAARIESPVSDPFAQPGIVVIPEEKTETQQRLGRPWQVIVWDDPVNLMSYVVYVFQTLFGMPYEEATIKMMEVHKQGRSIVKVCDREDAEVYVEKLHGFGLQATMEGVDE